MSMILRRQMMRKAAADDYITDGLAFQLDGINKGNTNGAWSDLISGEAFTAYNGVTFGPDCIQLDGAQNQYLENTSIVLPINADNTGLTIEAAVEYTQNGATMLVLMPGNPPAAFGILNGTKIISTTGIAKAVVLTQNGFSVASISDSDKLVDGVTASTSGADMWGGVKPGTNFVGKRSSGNYFTGKIYAIRIYSRNLTADEMLHNQRIDNARFNLGLTI